MARPSAKTTKKTAPRPKKVTKPALVSRRKSPKKEVIPAGPRKIRLPKYRSFRVAPQVKHPVKLPSGWDIFKRSIRTVLSAKKLFIGVVAIYAILMLILVQWLGNTSDVQTLKDTLSGGVKGQLGNLVSGLAVFSFLAASAGSNASTTTSPYQSILVIFVSLVVIWALRQTVVGTKVRIRDAFYRGGAPLVVVLLVLLVMALQLIPAYIGAQLYSLVLSGSLAVLMIEKVLWGMLLFLFVLLSLYMVSSSIFALYIVTLPNMTPMKALRSARELVRYRRWTVMRKILYMVFILFVAALVVMLPIILLATGLAAWIFFAISMIGIVLIHAYMYTLYRDLLIEA